VRNKRNGYGILKDKFGIEIYSGKRGRRLNNMKQGIGKMTSTMALARSRISGSEERMQ
jgi:hypothetical protein